MRIVTFAKAFVSISTAIVALAITPFASAAPFSFSTGPVTDSIGVASRPASGGSLEIEAADDFVLTDPTRIDSATFTGLLSGADAADVNRVLIEIYRVFPLDSDVGRTSGSPTFSTSQVPTRVNSPSDVALDSRDSAAAELTFSSVLLNASFTALNSVLNGIVPSPNQHTGGEGAVTGVETQFNVSFSTPVVLPAGHYFFVPQVELTGPGQFYWLSATRNPIQPPGTPFAPDLQSWIRNENLAPDWLRIGTDIVGAPASFNQAFSLSGTVPEPGSLMLLGIALASLAGARRRAR